MSDKKTSIKFGEWRPIGVCDEGEGQERKAKIFSSKDLSIVTAPGVGRDTWQKQSAVNKLVRRYAKSVAKISPLTQGMSRPVVVDVRLVGLVLHFDKTPTLNTESEDGRVQLFQVEFADRPKKKSRWWKWLLIILGMMLILGLIASGISYFSKPAKRSKVPFCQPTRASRIYANHVLDAQRLVTRSLGTSEIDNRPSCKFRSGKLLHNETQLLTCLLSVRNADPSKRLTEPKEFRRVDQCAANICDKSIPELKNLCNRL